jgi:hypothetical protein
METQLGSYAQYCLNIELSGASFSAAVTTTTTTEQHGLNGKVFDTSTSTSATSVTWLGNGSYGCVIQ